MDQIRNDLALYHAWVSSASRRVRFVLEEKEIAYQGILVDLLALEQHSPEYIAINPNGVVPTLVHKRRPIVESSAICEYLDEVFPENPLRPSDPHARAQMRGWAKWTDEVVIRAFQVANWNRMMAPTAQQWSDAEVALRLAAVPVPDRREDWRRMAREPFNDREIEHSINNIERTLSRMESVLKDGPWLAGDTFSLADIHLSPYIVRLGEHAERGIRLSDYPCCQGWWDRLSVRPAFQRARIEPVTFNS